MKRKAKKIIKIFIITFFVIWFFSIIKCEILTQLHGREFSKGYWETNMIGRCDYLKVINYSSDSAKVYYVETKVYGYGDLLSFKKINDSWIIEKWETIWSKYGSADDFIWPYLRKAIINPVVYEKYSFDKIGVTSDWSYQMIVEKKGKPTKEKQNKDRLDLYYDGLQLQFEMDKRYPDDKSYAFMNKAIVTGDQYRFGPKNIGVDSTRKEVKRAYKFIKTIKNLEENELGYKDNHTWITYYFDEKDIVKEIHMIYVP